MTSQTATEGDVHQVQKHSKPKQKTKPFNPKSFKSQDISCKYCGQKHERAKCPAYGKKCGNCSKPNHFAAVCLSKAHKVNKLEESDGSTTEEEILLVTDKRATSKIFVTMFVQGIAKKFQVDSGATCNMSYLLTLFLKMSI